MFAEKVKNWGKQFQKYYFTYKDGFYHLPYNGSSPESLVRSLSKFPFVKHLKEKQYISSKNPLCEGGFFYHQLEDGLWLVYSNIRYKANVAFDLFLESDETADDYYMLSLNQVNNSVELPKSVKLKRLCFPNYSLSFIKPKERQLDLNFKGAQCRFLTVYLNERWVEQNLVNHHLFKDSKLDQFIRSDQKFILWALSGKLEVLQNFELFDGLLNLGKHNETTDWLNVKFATLGLILAMLKLCRTQNIVDYNLTIPNSDSYSVKQVEHYLCNHLLEKFPGITFLSERFNISETKLKNEFRQLFGMPIYQYFKDRQMHLAKELLSESQWIVKEVSHKLGYENSSKFTAAFKKYHGLLPSEIRNT